MNKNTMYNVDKYFDFEEKKLTSETSKKKQQQQILLIVLLIGLAYYFMIYLPEEKKKNQSQPITSDKSLEELKEEQEKDSWDKGRIWELPVNGWADIEVNKMKSTLVRKYQEDASVFANGDRDERFYFSRAATYEIFLPPSLREYHEEAEEKGVDVKHSMIEQAEELIISNEIKIWEDRVLNNPTRGEPDSDGKDNSALFYGAPGTGKTATVKNVCYNSDKYPLVTIKGSSLTPTKEDQETGILPLKKFAYTISELEWSLDKEFGFERKENGEIRYILFVDEADQISNNALTHDPTKLRFLKDCLEGVNKSARSQNLWIFATNYLKDVDEAVYREGRLSNPLNFSWNWNEFKKYMQEYGVYDQLPKRWQKQTFLKPEDNRWVTKFNKKLFQKEFLGIDSDNPNKKKFWELFITNNPNAKYDPKKSKETDEEEVNNDSNEEDFKEIEIGEFLEFFWGLYDSRSLDNYEGKYTSFQKSTIEKSLEIGFTNLINKLDEELDDIITELKTNRDKVIRKDIQKIFEILGKR